jgi:hypothetical protein
LYSSYFEKEVILSQIPYDHVNIDIVKFYYGQEAVGKKSFLKEQVSSIKNGKLNIIETRRIKAIR